MTTANFLAVKDAITGLAPQVDFWSARLVMRDANDLCVRKGTIEQVKIEQDLGVMISVHHGGGCGYAATSNLSSSGLATAFAQAQKWAKVSSSLSVLESKNFRFVPRQGEYSSPVLEPWASTSTRDKIDQLSLLCEKLKIHQNIVDWSASLANTTSHSFYFCSQGSSVKQNTSIFMPLLQVTASNSNSTQTRSLHGGMLCRQGGLEVAKSVDLEDQAQVIASQALQLLDAPNCPTGAMDLLLAPDQMVLQIHESIGHPLELDRILGDERNYAGTSFVSLDMFGSYQYGSSLLNVTFDPDIKNEAASYAFDDDVTPAKKTHIIKNGVLEKPLGGALSQARAGIAGVANSRACSWNRPPMDRMANLNIEPGSSSFADMVAAVENGIFMQTNCSWSIDDSRNKFQFGCEWAQLIEKGKLTTVIRNPNYRGISASFWRNLKMVGDQDSFKVMAASNCGKGEPNQAVLVGHATPACLFTAVNVFGGE